jgi:hypothetical protein
MTSPIPTTTTPTIEELVELVESLRMEVEELKELVANLSATLIDEEDE